MFLSWASAIFAQRSAADETSAFALLRAAAQTGPELKASPSYEPFDAWLPPNNEENVRQSDGEGLRASSLAETY
jgi:hypothetical protein